MFKYDYKYAILLDKLRNGEDLISFSIWIHYIQGGGVNHPFCWTLSRIIYHIYNIFILLYCCMPLHTFNV